MEFLRSVARAYVPLLETEERLSEYTFILPNRRSVKFFQKYLGEEYYKLYNKPLFAPKLLTINDFIINLGGLKLADPIMALYVLYKNYRDLKLADAVNESVEAEREIESFDDFVYWGDMILKDFDDIDKYLVNAVQIFSNVKDLKDLSGDYSYLTKKQINAIESFWGSFFMDPYTDKKQIFFSLWHVMFDLYNNFRSDLLDLGVAYEGQIYRKVAEDIENMDIPGVSVFIGLNAPNKCERKIMNYLRDAGRGDFYWDFYGELLTNPDNSAGRIIRECVERYPSRYSLPDADISCGIPEINVYGVSSGVGQAFKIADILNGIDNDENIIKSCIQLPDEKLLMPVLNSIPEKFDKINVTMGYPISQTAFISFMNLISELQRGIKLYGKRECFYYKNINDILDHPFICGCGSNRSNSDSAKYDCGIGEEVANIRRRMLEINMVFVPCDAEIFADCSSVLLQKIFKHPVTSDEIAQYQIDILKEIEKRDDELLKEFVYQYYLKISSLNSLNIEMQPKTYFKLLRRITQGITIPFRGEPLEGLQLMGSLETRAIDFDNLIIASANEGIFPSGNVNSSLIPYNLRIGFDLPTYELQDSIAAYHFYRSICRVKRLYMIYDTRRDGLISGEASRYIKQLKYHFNLKVNESVVAYRVKRREESAVLRIEKGEDIIGKLKNKKTFSISAINNYFICPMKFYFSNVLNIKDEDEISEDLEASTFGSIFHKVMENLYKPYVGKVVDSETIKSILKSSDLLQTNIRDAFREISNITEIHGRREIEFALIENYVQLTLRKDLSRVPFRYIAGEAVLYRDIEIYPGGNRDNPPQKVTFRGDIDRQEERDGMLYILDYKTGSVDKSSIMEDNMDILFDPLFENKYHIARQLYMYAFLNRIESDTVLMIYGLREIASGSHSEILAEPGNIERFGEKLGMVMEEIFNPDIPFVNKPGCDGCRYCEFSSLCNK